MAAPKFPDFSDRPTRSLDQLDKDQTRACFQAHRADYEESDQGPFPAFIDTMQADLDKYMATFWDAVVARW